MVSYGKILKKVAIIIGVIGLLAGCGGGGGGKKSPAGAFSISGQVKSSSGIPVYNAKVSLNNGGAVANTDRNGVFTLKNVASGQMTVAVEKSGYQKNQATIEVKADVTDYQLKLSPAANTATISGGVTLGD